jgi:predicted ATPase/DNA-binding SARP family transcriptional activator
MLHLYTFGGLRIEDDGQSLQLSTYKARDLLAYLIAFRDRAHPRSVLTGLLWPDLPEDRARRRLSDTLWRIRRVLGDHVLADEEYIWFNTDLPHWLDAEQFQSVASSLKPETLRAEPRGEAADLRSIEDTLALYQGPFLDGLYHDWILLERERLRGLYLQTLGHLLELHKQVGDYAAALTIAQRLVVVEPLHEAAHRELMRLYHLLSRDAEAVAQYHHCREILREELDVAPAPETEALYQVLSRRASLPPATTDVHLPTPSRRPAFNLDEPPLVGRQVERAALLSHLEAAASGQGGIVLLEGEAGIGKSRLARDLVAGARWRNIAAVVVRADENTIASYGLFLAALFPPLTSLRLRQLTRLVEPAHLQATTHLLPAIAEALPDMPPLPDLPPPQASERLQQALVALVLGLARIAPHLWVLEDLQWADAETLSLLPLLASHLTGSRILFLLTGRSAGLRANPAAWSTLQALDRAGSLPRYTLTRLDTDAIGSLVRDLLGEDDLTLSEHLTRESDGIPLYLVETLKAWRDEGYLLPAENETWHRRGDAPTVPSSYLGEAVIGHRLSHLSPTAEEVLAAAAVIGAEVDFDLLTRVCSRPPDRYLLSTDELLRLSFLVETDVGYRFSHDRVRQAVYRRLSLSQRQRLHRNVALALEDLSPEQFELLAHHFAAAGQREPAIHYLTHAARRARELFAHQTAMTCYDRLLDLLTHPQDRPARYDVLRDRAEVLGWVGDREAQGRDLEEMLRLARDLSDDARIAATLRLRSEWYRLQGHYEPAYEDALAALEIYRRLGDDHNQAALLSQLGWNVIYTANYAQAAGYFREALSIYRGLDDLQGQISCLSGLTNAAELDGRYSLALSYMQQNMALAEATGDPRRIGRALHNMGVLHYDLGDIDTAKAHLYEALHLKESTGDRRSQALTHYYLGVVIIEHGDFEAAQAHLDIALEALREVQDASWEGDTLAALGRLALLRNDPDAAKKHLGAAYQRRQELGEPAYAIIDLSYLALAELALGDEAAAWQHSQETVAELEAGLSGVEHPQRIYYNHYRVARATRHWAAARAALEEAAHIVNERAERIDDPALRKTYRTGIRANRAIAEAAARLPPPGRLRVRLPRADTPAHRRPTADETVAVIWTIDAGREDTALAEQEGKVVLRHHRILRLLAEADAAGTLPTAADLAGVLDVSSRTIRNDMAILRREGHAVRTRGSRA